MDGEDAKSICIKNPKVIRSRNLFRNRCTLGRYHITSATLGAERISSKHFIGASTEEQAGRIVWVLFIGASTHRGEV